MAEKTKLRYRLIAVIGIVAALGAIVYGVWTAGQAIHIDKIVNTDFEGTPKDVAITKAEKVSIEGVWNISVSIGEPKLEIYDNDENRLKHITSSVSDGLLSLVSDQDGLANLVPVKAKLWLPSLSGFKAEGASIISLNDFKSDKLSISIKGPVILDIKGAKVEHLDLAFEGAAKIDTPDSQITNAAVHLEGAGAATLAMAGGTLTGSVKGLGKLDYSGIVSSVQVDKDGPFALEHLGADNSEVNND